MDDSTKIVLFGLSVSDMIYSCCETYNRIIMISSRVDLFLAYKLFAYYATSFFFMSAIALVTSVWLVSLISIERMIAVCFPFHVSRLMSPTRMSCMVVFVFTFITFLFSPLCGRFYLDWAFDPRYNKTLLTYFQRKEYDENEWWIDIILIYILPPVVSTVPMITILICTFATILKLITANNNFGKLSTSRTKRVNEIRSIKISLIICCSMAFSTLIPNAFLDAYPTIAGENVPLEILIMIKAFTQLAVQINATMNFFIYVALSSKFKSTCFNLIQCKHLKQN
ncbi:unnamed protein product, partial [Lymnaea stagnalis]